MLRLDANKPVRFCDGMSRRDFLHAGSLTAMGLSLTDLMALKAQGAVKNDTDKNCIFLFLVGGPSQLDTFDSLGDGSDNVDPGIGVLGSVLNELDRLLIVNAGGSIGHATKASETARSGSSAA